MVISRPVKVLVGAATFWPLLYIVLFLLVIFSSVVTGGMRTHHAGSGPPKLFLIIFVLHFLTILGTFGLLAFYLTYLFKTDRIAQDKKALWAVVLFMGNMIAMPVFFVLYIWPDAPKSSELQSPGPPK